MTPKSPFEIKWPLEKPELKLISLFLDDEDFGGDLTGLQPQTERLSCNFVDCIGSRELGLPRVGGNRFFSERLSSEYGTRHMLSNGMMKETSIGNYWQIFVCLFVYFAIIQSTFRLFKGQQYLNNMLRINK